jgi:hypothetical protein
MIIPASFSPAKYFILDMTRSTKEISNYAILFPMPKKLQITDVNQVTPEWLTNTLLLNGAMTQGKVASFDIDKGKSNYASNAKLRLHYSEDAQGELPARLFLKIVITDLGDEFFGESEVTYYTRDYIGVPHAPLVRCYDAAFSEEKQHYHLLLDDISETHREARTAKHTLAYGQALVEGLAILHAHWWGAERLAAAKVEMHSPAHIKRFVEIAEPGMGHILDAFSNQLAPHWPALMKELYAKHPQAMINRTKNANGFTLIHGDLGAGNIMVPHNGIRPMYFIDRQPFDWSMTNWLGVYDLSYHIVLDWDIETRRELEIPLLKHYHQHLIQHGVEGYSWEQLYDDYRLSAAMGVYIATEYCRGGINSKWINEWLNFLKRSLTVIDDLKCHELWE